VKRHRAGTEVVIITGLSGAGRSEASNNLEDLGYFVIDNLPPALIGKMVDLVSVPGSSATRLVLVVDARGGQFFEDLESALVGLRRRGVHFRIVYLEASDEALLRRFEATRRLHPLGGERVIDGIRREREMLRGLRGQADLIIDTSDVNVHELREKMVKTFGGPKAEEGDLRISVLSFGFKYGLPLDADVVIDVRFLPNPHWKDELRPLTGLAGPVRDYVMEQDPTGAFLERFEALLEVLIPGYQAEGKHYLGIAVGCTGGKHRSVVLTEEIGAYLRDRGLTVAVEHRDIGRE